ncbi:hypothetical protein GGTG_03737 [Gaeumannomyces tritici R3-111a-1]|uniref:Uncharacterized protein n=1 Tax=Gaeumannomyces tritici (strain R3-111a-1) TaxID=644352 RepID=J3NR32_GAET3|nr:hypothetical protein GGTG_03737 [Gaeumannomyces tritici R3-111a-1]EJT78638.1 hypothetical protein GGTG_03737 [Gaeumannomyces tritici R3-111a-1]
MAGSTMVAGALGAGLSRWVVVCWAGRFLCLSDPGGRRRRREPLRAAPLQDAKLSMDHDRD